VVLPLAEHLAVRIVSPRRTQSEGKVPHDWKHRSGHEIGIITVCTDAAGKPSTADLEATHGITISGREFARL
jgi:hypothetical protein